jgi:hypothetical protein
MRKAVCSCLTLAALIGFFASRQPVTEAQKPGKYAEMIRELHDKPASKKLVEEFVNDGTPALDALLNDFAKSDFAKKVRAKADKDFNIGKAINDSVYAKNVIKVAEAFGSAGFDRLVKRTDPKTQKLMSLHWKNVKKKSLEKEAIRPLLIGEIARGMKSPEEKARQLRWIDRYVDVAKLKAIDATGKETADAGGSWFPFAGIHALLNALCAANLAHPILYPTSKEAAALIRMDRRGEFLSPSVRAKLRPLDRPK